MRLFYYLKCSIFTINLLTFFCLQMCIILSKIYKKNLWNPCGTFSLSIEISEANINHSEPYTAFTKRKRKMKDMNENIDYFTDKKLTRNHSTLTVSYTNFVFLFGTNDKLTLSTEQLWLYNYLVTPYCIEVEGGGANWAIRRKN